MGVSPRAVVFDVGETLIDESRVWATWARLLGVPPFTLAAVIGALIERGEPHERAFGIVRPDLDLRAELARHGFGPAPFDANDLYPDVRPALARLRGHGLFLGVAGNQPPAAMAALERLDLPVDLLATSAGWGVAKPSPAFFFRLAEAVPVSPDQIAYVGDRLDNDVLPARAAGMTAVFLRRGPWGVLQAARPEADRAHLRVESLHELVDLLTAGWSPPG